MEARHDSLGPELSLVAVSAGRALADEVQHRMSADGYRDVRLADGLVFQQLLPGALTIGALARNLGISQQAASKSVVDLERRGYVQRRTHASDRRARLVSLTRRGRAAVKSARRHRAALDDELADRLGSGRVRKARKLLVEVPEALDAGNRMRAQSARPPR
jgi:DNA-binding MarR family transcriptional regulator